MNFDATTIAQSVGWPGELIGYSDQSVNAFRHGWISALDCIYRVERNAIGDSVINELGLSCPLALPQEAQ